MRNKRSELARGIERILQVEGETKRGLAKRLDVSETQVQKYLSDDLLASSLIRILDAMGYEILFRKKTGMGMVNVLDYDPCEGCHHKFFAEQISDALDNYRVSQSDAGTEIDFYSE